MIIGARGRVSVDSTIIGVSRFRCFGFSNCHLIFILLVVGNIVREVAYVNRM